MAIFHVAVAIHANLMSFIALLHLREGANRYLILHETFNVARDFVSGTIADRFPVLLLASGANLMNFKIALSRLMKNGTTICEADLSLVLTRFINGAGILEVARRARPPASLKKICTTKAAAWTLSRRDDGDESSAHRLFLPSSPPPALRFSSVFFPSACWAILIARHRMFFGGVTHPEKFSRVWKPKKGEGEGVSGRVRLIELVVHDFPQRRKTRTAQTMYYSKQSADR